MSRHCPGCRTLNSDETKFCAECGLKLVYGTGERSGPGTRTYEIPYQSLEIGSRFAGRYKILEELGFGGMGRVYRVLDREVKEEIALKLLRSDVASSKKARSRFRDELKIARKIAHRNVCRMFDFGQDEKIPYITMEYIPGEDLKSVVKMTGPSSPARTVFVAKQICRGLAEAHRLGIVHRDLKSSNIMVDKKGDVHIMDFGIARFLEQPQEHTRSRVVIGTPAYMSPEQFGGEEVDQRSDIFSLGIVLYEMLTGQVPLQEMEEMSRASMLKNGRVPDPGKLKTGIPDKLNELIFKCLSPKKEDRFQTVEEVLKQLDGVEENFSTSEKIVSGGKSQKIGRGWLAAVMAAVLFLAAWGIFMLVRSEKPEMTLAVLPFRHSLDLEGSYLTEAINEEMTMRLATLLPGLNVLTPQSTIQYKNSDKDSRAIGREIGATHIVTGSLGYDRDELFINVFLQECERGTSLFSKKYLCLSPDYYSIVSQFVEAVGEQLRVGYSKERERSLAGRETGNPKSREYYYLGKHYESRYRSERVEENFKTALEYFEKSMAEDADFALAMWGIGNLYEMKYVQTRDQTDLDQMLLFYQNAYNLAPDLPEASVGLGWAYYYKENNFRAVQNFKRALKLDENRATTLYHTGAFLRSIGLYQESIIYLDRYLKKESMSLESIQGKVQKARALMLSGRYEEGLFVLDGVDVPKDFIGFIETERIKLCILLRDFERAWKIIREYEEQPKAINPARLIRCRAWLLAAEGKADLALAQVGEVDLPYYEVTAVLALCGREDQALAMIEQGMKNGFEWVLDYMYTWPVLTNLWCYDGLKGNPRFDKTVEEQKVIHDNLMKIWKK